MDLDQLLWYEETLSFPKGGCHILMAIPRKKENDEMTSGKRERALMTRIVTTWEEWVAWYLEMKSYLWDNYRYRIYTTYNPRSLEKGCHNLLNSMLACVYNKSFSKLAAGKNLVISSLKKQWTALVRQYYMIDVDDNELDYVKYIIKSLGSPDFRCVKTPNGFHVLVKPFNVTLLKDFSAVEVKKDELLYVETV